MTDKRMLVCILTTLAAMGAALSAHHSHAVCGDSSIFPDGRVLMDSQNRNAVTQ